MGELAGGGAGGGAVGEAGGEVGGEVGGSLPRRAPERVPKGRLQVRKTAAGGWTAAKREAFLERLATTCNVAASARAVGMVPRGAHALRARDPVFAAAWAGAIEAAYETLEARLLAYAMGDDDAVPGEEAGSVADGDSDAVAGGVVDGDSGGDVEGDAGGDAEGDDGGVADGDGRRGVRRGAHFDPRVAVQALGLRRRSGGALAQAAGPGAALGVGLVCKRVSIAEVEAALIAKLDALDRIGDRVAAAAMAAGATGPGGATGAAQDRPVDLEAGDA